MPAKSVTVNGEIALLMAATVAALLDEKEIGAQARGVAVALNGAVVPRKAWPSTAINPGDVVEIVRAQQGG